MQKEGKRKEDIINIRNLRLRFKGSFFGSIDHLRFSPDTLTRKKRSQCGF